MSIVLKTRRYRGTRYDTASTVGFDKRNPAYDHRIAFRNRPTTNDLFLFSDELDHDLAVSWFIVEFREHDLLPGAEQ